MELPLASEHRTKVGEFQRKHHTRLLALLFTDIVGSTDLKRELGDFPAVTIIQNNGPRLSDGTADGYTGHGQQ